MLNNRPSATQPQGQVLNNVLAIPVGTNTIIGYDKFMWDKRDENCVNCKNGMKSMVSKRVNEKTYNVPVVCPCVPYIQSEDADGVQVVVFKGRRERWIKGKRPEIYLSDEKVRAAANQAAVSTKDAFEGDNVIQGKKYQFVRAGQSAPRAEFLSKAVPGMPITRPGDVPTEFTTRSSIPENPKYGQVTAKNLEKAVPGAQKHLQTLPNGNRVFVDDATFAKLSGKSVPVVAPITVTTSAGNPGNPNFTVTISGDPNAPKKRGRPKKSQEAPAQPFAQPAVPAQVASTEAGVEKKKRGRPKKVQP